MKKEDLQELLAAHKEWLESSGKSGRKLDLWYADFRRANLQYADLRYADLRHADLRHTDLRYADLRYADLQRANLQYANLQGANLQGANLWVSYLRHADLRGVDVDYASWPLWCGGLGAKTDRRIMAQLAYHFCKQDCDDPDYIAARNAILDFANTFHRVKECGTLEVIGQQAENQRSTTT